MFLSVFFFLFFSSAQDSLSIYRVDAQNHLAVISAPEIHEIKTGDKYKIATPEGDCVVPVTEILEGFVYIDTQTCKPEYVQKGSFLSSHTESIMPDMARAMDPPQNLRQLANLNSRPARSADSAPLAHSENSVSVKAPENETPAFYKDRVSAYISYHSEHSSSSSVTSSSGQAYADLNTANTFGLGLEMLLTPVQENWGLVLGTNYQNFRHYNNPEFATGVGGTSDSFPELQLWSNYLQLRYRFLKESYFFLGGNRLIARTRNLQGSLSGDFGLKVGARHQFPNRLFVDGGFNFNNLRYALNGERTNMKLSEVEFRLGYTF